MGVGEWLAWVLLLLLALYGCAQLIRQLCLWFWRCKDVNLYRIAVPRQPRAVEPLLRCLQAQAAWQEGAHTYVLLPDSCRGELAMLRQLAQGQQVLLFTCHSREKELLEGAGDVTFLAL